MHDQGDPAVCLYYSTILESVGNRRFSLLGCCLYFATTGCVWRFQGFYLLLGCAAFTTEVETDDELELELDKDEMQEVEVELDEDEMPS